MDTILLVDDEQDILDGQRKLLELNGFSSILAARSIEEAQSLLERHETALVMLDLTLSGASGEVLLDYIKRDYPETVVIVLTGTSDISTAVACMRAGAHEYLVKGTDTERIPGAVRNALEHRRTMRENALLHAAFTRPEPVHPESFSDFVTASGEVRRILVYLEVLSTLPDPILITGETGVGKEVIARGIHRAANCDGDFVAVNLAGVDDHSFSDTLFGHRKGAYTGADSNRDGMIKAAAGGTIFLDEIGDMPMESQVRLLRVLDSGEYRPLGQDRAEFSRARIICATNRDLEQAIDAKQFRRDLYFRISTHRVHIPSLRERPRDIGPILEQLVSLHANRLKLDPLSIPGSVVEVLGTRPLSGNVRELEQVVLRALIERNWDHVKGVGATSDRKASADVAGEQRSPGVTFGENLPTPDEVVCELLREADRRHPESRSAAAFAIGLSPQAFANRRKRMDV